ncbi:hypothetical protein RRSWK_04955 [Rhodopirellula sp. SWK7]|nr:hypothetical protein RRSWK_04955 [Rhodopirellula sp. SWK7]
MLNCRVRKLTPTQSEDGNRYPIVAVVTTTPGEMLLRYARFQ